MSGLLILLVATACGVGGAQSTGERYDIPPENLLKNTFAGEYVEFIYGDVVATDGNQVGLVFEGEEVAVAIPGFHTRTQGYLGLIDESPSAVVGPILATSNFDELLVANVERLDTSRTLTRYGDTDFFWDVESRGNFDLSDEGGTWLRDDMLPPGCTISQTQSGEEYHSCLFRMESDGLEYSIWLSGENISFADEFVAFVRAKLDSWKVD